MVVLKDNYPRFTPEEYLAWEEQQLERHELIDGQAYAMSGGTINHCRIGIKVTAMPTLLAIKIRQSLKKFYSILSDKTSTQTSISRSTLESVLM